MAKKSAVEVSTQKYIKNVERDAKKNLVGNNSVFKGGILGSFKKKFGKKESILWVDSYYAPYVEWGTKRNFKLEQASLASFAASFKGSARKSNKFRDIKDWAAQKGISKKDTFKITRALFKEGNKAHPFFYRAVFANTVSLRRDLKRALKKRR